MFSELTKGRISSAWTQPKNHLHVGFSLNPFLLNEKALSQVFQGKAPTNQNRNSSKIIRTTTTTSKLISMFCHTKPWINDSREKDDKR